MNGPAFPAASATRLRAQDGPCYAKLKAQNEALLSRIDGWQRLDEEYLLAHEQLAALRLSRARELCLVGTLCLTLGLAAWPLTIVLLWGMP
jgi:hypothetical protein